MSLKKNLFIALVAVATLSMIANDSKAFFGLFHGGSCGSGGGWGSRGGGGSGGGWGSRGGSGSCGSHGGGGSWGGGSWGSSGSDGGYGSNGGSFGGYGSAGGYSSYDSGWSGGYARSGVVYGRIVATESAGRQFVAQSAVKTRLTIQVPSDATVTLAGVATKQTGESRQFTTTKLANGQVWNDYKVVVSLDRNGQTLREERTIQLTGGQSQELSINFDSQQLAQR